MMYDGTILGEFIKLEQNKQIEMKWKLKDWNEFAHVIVTFEGGDKCEITVKVDSIPECDKF